MHGPWMGKVNRQLFLDGDIKELRIAQYLDNFFYYSVVDFKSIGDDPVFCTVTSFVKQNCDLH